MLEKYSNDSRRAETGSGILRHIADELSIGRSKKIHRIINRIADRPWRGSINITTI